MRFLGTSLLACVATSYALSASFVVTPYTGLTNKGNACKGPHYKPLTVEWTGNPEAGGPCVKSSAPASSNSSSYSDKLSKGSSIPSGYVCVIWSYYDDACSDFNDGGPAPSKCTVNGANSPYLGSYQAYCTNQDE